MMEDNELLQKLEELEYFSSATIQRLCKYGYFRAVQKIEDLLSVGVIKEMTSGKDKHTGRYHLASRQYDEPIPNSYLKIWFHELNVRDLGTIKNKINICSYIDVVAKENCDAKKILILSSVECPVQSIKMKLVKKYRNIRFKTSRPIKSNMPGVVVVILNYDVENIRFVLSSLFLNDGVTKLYVIGCQSELYVVRNYLKGR